MHNKLDEFLTIAKQLNVLGIVPLLMGSVGLEILTGKDWNAKDLDIHVPGDERVWEVPPETAINDWEAIKKMMNDLGYRLINLHEHEFYKDGLFSVEFGIIDTLPDFAGVELDELELHESEGATYYLLNPKQYLALYKASSRDSYRGDQNNHKDFVKIDFLEQFLENDYQDRKYRGD